MKKTESPTSQPAFSLLELLCVMGIMVALMALTLPAIRAISGAGTVNKAAGDLSRTIEMARIHAMANQTYVRVAFAEISGKGIATLCLASNDGTLDAVSKSELENPAKWAQIDKALYLENFRIDDVLEAVSPSTAEDAMPSDSRAANSGFVKFNRTVGELQGAEFNQFIQFAPNGEARVKSNSAARFIKIGIDRSDKNQAGQNPFLVRLSGSNGTVKVLRKESL